MPTCSCLNCSQHLEFDAVHAGTVIGCPTCHGETRLYIPPLSAVREAMSDFGVTNQDRIEIEIKKLLGDCYSWDAERGELDYEGTSVGDGMTDREQAALTKAIAISQAPPSQSIGAALT